MNGVKEIARKNRSGATELREITDAKRWIEVVLRLNREDNKSCDTFRENSNTR